MLRRIPQKPKNNTNLTNDLKDYLLKRDTTVKQALPVQTPPSKERKHLDVQVIVGEMESQLMNMDQADARVQRILAKLHELKTAVMFSVKS
jgi:uncharacterized protein YgbK (DUF1537 family)